MSEDQAVYTVETTAVTVTQRAAVALKAVERRQQFIALAAQSAGITAITNGDGYKECHAARMRLKAKRIETEKESEEVRADAVLFQKAIISLEDELVGVILPEEKRLQSIQDAWDEKIEYEKQAGRRAEQDRIAAEQKRIADEEKASREAEQARIAAAQAEINRQKSLLFEAEVARIKAEADAAVRIAKAERDAAARIEAAERAARQKIEDEERAVRQAREAADRQARAALEAEQAAVRAAEADAKRKKIIEEARIASENERLAREQRSLEDAQRRAREAKEAQDRAGREAVEAKARADQDAQEAEAKAERDRVEAEEREKRLAEQEVMDGLELLRSFVARFAGYERFMPVVAAVRSFLAVDATCGWPVDSEIKG